ncbi:glycosyltransferase [Nostoc sp. CHAB 5834]|nr:glycosyltransferase [Nostoc sp. CHAB 5834]
MSIITINLNNQIGLDRTIKSVLNQTDYTYEFLVIDGASTDGSLDTIKNFSSKIHYWVSEADNGIYHAMNKGIQQASGKYCLFLNSGDWLDDSSVLETFCDQNYNTDLVVGGCHVVAQEKRIYTYQLKDELTFQSFYKATIPHQSTFIKRTLFETLGVYNESYMIHGDYDFWIRSVIVNQCTIASFNYVVSNYNMEGISNNYVFQKKSCDEIQHILQNYIPERILADYEYWKIKRSELGLWEWVKQKKTLHKFLFLLYNQAIVLISFKNKVYRTWIKRIAC